MDKFEPDLKVTRMGRLQILRFNRPEKKNALGEKVYKGVKEALRLAKEDDGISITVLTGTGDFYSSGNDLSEISPGAESMADLLKEKLHHTKEFVRAFIDHPKLIFAVVNGPAIGIAVTTLGLCDIVFASDTATFQTPFTKLGITAEGCSSYLFPRIMGPSMAGQMLYLNYTMKAMKAKSCGLVAEVVNQKKLSSLFEKLQIFADLPMKSLVYTKQLIRDDEREVLHRVNDMEMERLIERFQSDECMEAFLNLMMNKKKKSKL